MKFVGLIQKFDIIDRELIINIPHYHRSSMGLVSKTSVYAVPRFYTGHSGSEFREIILTPFKPNSWSHLWKIEMTTKEFPGVVKQITSVISKEKINILVQESLTTEQEKTHAITIIADIINYTGDNNLEELKLKLKNLKDERGEIITQSVNIRRMEFLANNSLSSEDVQKIYGNEDFLNSPVSSLIENRKGKLPYRVLRYLKIDDSFTHVNASIFSDTEEKYLIVYLFSKRQNAVAIDIVHDDSRGAIAKFTSEIIKVDKNINILSCFNRIESMSNISHWNAILDITSCERVLEDLLGTLKKCEYNSFNVKFVWLADWVNAPDENMILKYGLVRWKSGNELNYVGNKKKKILIQECISRKIPLEAGNEKKIIKELDLQGSEEEVRLLKQIFQETEESKERISIKKRERIINISLKLIALIVMLILIYGFIKLSGIDLFEIAKSQFKEIGKYLLIILSIAIYIFIYNLLHKFGDKILKLIGLGKYFEISTKPEHKN